MTNYLKSILHTEDDLFYFESDHLALKGNKDYCEVLKTIVILTAQRERALKDLKTVTEVKKEALANPLSLLEKIKNKEDLGLPSLLELPKIPRIDFDKYDVKISEEDMKLIYSDITSEKTEEDVKQIKRSHQKMWTSEEQKKLEELLLVYPPEPIEMRRFQKIAKALGTRTVQQVSSRVQKYFLKLYRAGLPIPGRIPKSSEKYKKSVLHKHQRHNHYLWKPTTFFPNLCVPVVMNDLDNIPGPSSAPPSTSGAENYLIPTDYHKSTSDTTSSSKDGTELQLDLLNRIKQDKMREKEATYYPFKHSGFRCDYCEDEPIVGSRWHCTACSDSVDFCTDCVLSQMYSENCHPLTHKLVVYYDDDNSNNLSDSESHSGSVFSNSNKYYDSESSESDIDHKFFQDISKPNGYIGNLYNMDTITEEPNEALIKQENDDDNIDSMFTFPIKLEINDIESVFDSSEVQSNFSNNDDE